MAGTRRTSFSSSEGETDNEHDADGGSPLMKGEEVLDKYDRYEGDLYDAPRAEVSLCAFSSL
jgi:hypothetical protein